MTVEDMAEHGWSLGPWVYPELRAQCQTAAAGLRCARPCCRRTLPPGDQFWQREPNTQGGLLQVNPHDGLRYVWQGYVPIDGEQWPCEWDDLRDPWVLRVMRPAAVAA